MRRQRPGFIKKFALAAAIAISLAATSHAQSGSELKADAPDRYVVKKGDTLWGLANRFLRDPWRWPLIWRYNDQIENPHLIYPGDLLVVTGDNNVKIVRLKPTVRKEPLERAIPTIPPHIIQPFLTSPLIVEPGELEEAGHVLIGVEDDLLLGKYNKFYARNISDLSAEEFRIFRIGRNLRHPETNELLGIEGIHLGDSKMLRASDDVSKLVVMSANEEIRPGDRLLPVGEEPPLPYFHPHAPDNNVTGWIIHAPKGVLEVGRFDVVIISGGTREGIEQGHVLRALWHRGTRKDPVSGDQYQLPDEESGLIMVFRVFEKVSYALVMESSRAISVGDRFESP